MKIRTVSIEACVMVVSSQKRQRLVAQPQGFETSPVSTDFKLPTTAVHVSQNRWLKFFRLRKRIFYSGYLPQASRIYFDLFCVLPKFLTKSP